MEGQLQEIGTRIRVDIPSLRRDTTETSYGGCYFFAEATEGRWFHYLDLKSPNMVPDDALEDALGSATGYSAKFDAEIVGPVIGSPAATTEVREIVSGRAIGATHYLYLSSSYITKLEPEPERRPVTFEDQKNGTRIRVEIPRVRFTGPERSEYGLTQSAQELDSPDRWRHFLFKNSGRSVKKIDGTDDDYTVLFDAEISVGDGEIRGGPSVTTRVRELVGGRPTGYVHYVYINSSCVTLLEPETISYAEAERLLVEKIAATPAPPPPVTTESKKGTTVSIDQYDETIDFSEVEDRIEELDELTETGYEVIRVRNDEILATYSDEEDADQYITDNDYDPERVIVRETDPDEDYVRELGNLNDLNYTCTSKFGRAWRDGDVTLYRQDYFDSDWARSRASDELNISYSETDETWPLNLIDWETAAIELRDSRYTLVEFDNETYYGEDR